MNPIAVKTDTIANFEDILEPLIKDYFTTINHEKFTKTANLFAETGQLLAPFAKPIQGRNAIANYLEKEAKGMQLLPQTYLYLEQTEQLINVQVKGQVKTSLFSVNVAWIFSLNQQSEINKVKIKLLASPQELLSLRSTKAQNN